MNDELTPLEKELQDLARNDFARFLQLLRKPAVRQLKACFMKQKGRSLGEISQNLAVPKAKAQRDVCGC